MTELDGEHRGEHPDEEWRRDGGWACLEESGEVKRLPVVQERNDSVLLSLDREDDAVAEEEDSIGNGPGWGNERGSGELPLTLNQYRLELDVNRTLNHAGGTNGPSWTKEKSAAASGMEIPADAFSGASHAVCYLGRKGLDERDPIVPRFVSESHAEACVDEDRPDQPAPIEELDSLNLVAYPGDKETETELTGEKLPEVEMNASVRDHKGSDGNVHRGRLVDDVKNVGDSGESEDEETEKIVVASGSLQNTPAMDCEGDRFGGDDQEHTPGIGGGPSDDSADEVVALSPKKFEFDPLAFKRRVFLNHGLDGLRELDLSSLGIDDEHWEVIKPDLRLVPWTNTLILDNNSLETFDGRILEELYMVEALSLTRNLLSNFHVSSLTKSIRRLNLAHNRLSEFPHCIYELTSLTSLCLDDNDIPSIGMEIVYLLELRIFSIRCNRIRLIPNELVALENLEVLLLSKNDIRSLPPGLSNLPRLVVCDFSDNPCYVNVKGALGDLEPQISAAESCGTVENLRLLMRRRSRHAKGPELQSANWQEYFENL